MYFLHWRTVRHLLCLWQFHFVVSICLLSPIEARTDDDIHTVVDIRENDVNGMEVPVAGDKLYTFEKDLGKQLGEMDGPNEIIVLASASPNEFNVDLDGRKDAIRELVIIRMYADHGELQWIDNVREKTCRRKLTVKQMENIKKFIADSAVDKLPTLGAVRKIRGNKDDTLVLDGTNYVYVHLDKRSGHRVNINNPPRDESEGYAQDDPLWKYTKVVDFFNNLKNVDESPMPK